MTNKMAAGSLAKTRQLAYDEAERLRVDLEQVCLKIHSKPELCYNEVYAHDTICDFLEASGFAVTRHAYGIETSFEAEIGSGSRLVIFCAEYDALVGIGHGCGHNLIAMASLTAFVASAKATTDLGIAGRIRILGTPAEEGGGGKIKLLDAGAFSDPGLVAAIMSHPMGDLYPDDEVAGASSPLFNAAYKTTVHFHGKPAHAAQAPWLGRNALDAAVSAYASISMMRQQIEPEDRIHGVITEGGKTPNIIPALATMVYAVRSPSAKRAKALMERLNDCFEAAAKATSCQVECEL